MVHESSTKKRLEHCKDEDGIFFCFLEIDFEVCQSNEWVIRVLVIVTDLFQNETENGMFRHATRDTFDHEDGI